MQTFLLGLQIKKPLLFVHDVNLLDDVAWFYRNTFSYEHYQ